MEDFETNIGSAAESAEMSESHDNEFIEGLLEGIEVEPETMNFGEESETPEETEPETKEEAEGAESAEKEAESEPEMISFKEHGKDFSAPKDVVEAFAKAVGRNIENLVDVYQKGCNYDKLNERYAEALKDSEALEKLAIARSLNKEALRAEVLATLEESKINEVVAEIKEKNPGISEETAKELAKFRIEQQKPKAEDVKEGSEQDSEETAARLREIEMFQARHPELSELPNEVIELWKTSGIPLEKAYKGFQDGIKVSELEKELAELKKENIKKEQKVYAREHTPGSATNSAGKAPIDPFVEGLFAEV